VRSRLSPVTVVDPTVDSRENLNDAPNTIIVYS
jgi:hypothetical protein